ncbi:MAG TPA: sigma-70 family RNA polymerase sigma factor [Planctomycetaceae bacterium]|nr:sigma-70 family RNA polymerase sigma factor [Planctomycetaceae bacterium]
MPGVPETRASLILRLPRTEDAEAWREFVAIYEPFVYRFARRNGFQEADARELVQNVLLSVVKAVGRWQADSQRGRFRTWLFTIARNQFLDQIGKKRRRPVRSGSSSLVDLLHQQPAPDRLAEELTQEHRRTLFRFAAARARESFKPSTWRAFWMTNVEQCPVEEAAEALGVSVGAVYIARARVLARLRDEVRQLEDDHAL